MATTDPPGFAALLTAAIQQIKRREGKPVRVIQDELGYALGKAGGSMVEFWRKGNLPARHADVELLARLLVRRGRLDRAWLEVFLTTSGYGAGASALCDELFPADNPVPPPPTAAPFQAPPPAPHFVGREAALDTLGRTLCGPAPGRVAALVGMGGAGKSTLAAQLAHTLARDFPDGVLWVYAVAVEPLTILQSWAQCYGYDFRTIPDVENRAAAVRGIWHGRRVLIVLDDVRDLAQLRPLLPGAGAALLLTTRDRDLAALANAQIVEVPPLDAVHSLALLRGIVGAARCAAEATAALAIVQTVGHLPLAVEIVARLLVRAPWQSLAEMAARLADATHRLDRLALKDMSVRAAFAVSWQVLPAGLRAVFTALGPFRARSCTFAAVASTAGIAQAAVEDAIATLAALSLLTVDSAQRVRQHPLLADFAREQIADAAALEARWAAHYIAFAIEHQTDPACVDVEMDNLLAVLEQLAARRRWEDVARLVDALHPVWLAHAHYAQAARGYAWAVAAATARDDEVARAQALIRLGFVGCELGDFHTASEHLQAGQVAAAQTGADTLVAEALFLRVRIAIEQNELEQADEWLDACHRIYGAAGDAAGLARTQREQGLLAYRGGDYTTAFARCREALAIQDRSGDAAGMLASLRLLADTAMATGDLVQALECAQRGLTLAQTEGRHAELAEAHYTLATVQRLRGELGEAETHAAEALARFTRSGNRSFIAYTLYEQSVILGRQARTDAALSCALQACDMQQTLGDDYGRVTTLIQVGDLHAARGDLVTAVATWQTGLDLAREIRYPHLQAFVKRLDATSTTARDAEPAQSGQLGG